VDLEFSSVGLRYPWRVMFQLITRTRQRAFL
jgi:hypothetical protein